MGENSLPEKETVHVFNTIQRRDKEGLMTSEASDSESIDNENRKSFNYLLVDVRKVMVLFST